MSHCQFWLVFLAVVLVDGWPRHHHKPKPAPDQKPKNQVVQYYQQATADQPLLDAPGDPQNLNVYNVQVQKSHKDNKVSGHMGPHSVSVSMQGPGTVSLDTSQLNVHPEDQQPDHTITMIKDSGACPQCSSVNVKTGLKGPVPLPLTGASTPVEQSKEEKPGHDGVSLTPDEEKQTRPKQKPTKADLPDEAGLTLDEENQKRPKQKPTKEDSLEEGQEPVNHVHEPEQLGHEPEEKDKSVTKPGAETPMTHVLHHIDKIANKVIKNLESSLPVATQKPKHEEQVINGHKLKIDSGGNHQKVVGKMDPNNVNVVAQGSQTVSVTSSGTDLSQDVVFDPNPYCPDKPCPPGQSGSEGKGHH